MKKRLSLLMVLMMVLSLVPMSAFASAGSVPGGRVEADDNETTVEQITVKLTQAAYSDLKAGQTRLTLSAGEFAGVVVAGDYAATDVPAADYKNMQESTFNAGGDNAVITLADGTTKSTVTTKIILDKAFKNVAYVQVPNVKVNSDDMDVLLNLQVIFDEEDAGDVTLAVEEVDSTNLKVSDLIKVAVIKEGLAEDLAMVITDATKKIGNDGGTLSKVEVKKFDGSGAASIKLELPDYITWDTSSLSLDGTQVAITSAMLSGDNNNIITLNVASTNKSILVEPAVKVVKRDASDGDITLKVTSFAGANATGKKIETVDGAIGILGNYDVAMSAVEKGKKEIPAIYGGEEATIKVKLSGVVGSFTDGRDIDFTIKGADIVTQKTTGSIAGSKTEGINPLSGKSVVVSTNADDGIVEDGEFTLQMVNPNKTVKDFEFELKIKTDYAQSGAVVLTAEGRDIGTLECELAKVTPAYTVEFDKVTQIKKGESLATANIVIKEAKAGMFDTDEFIVLNLDDVNRAGLSFGSGYKVEGTNGLKLDDSLLDEKGVEKEELNTIAIEIKTASSKEAGVITISNVVVMVSGSEVDGNKNLETYVVEANDDKKAVLATIDADADYDYSVPYINVVKEYGVTATKTVFVIGSKAYTVNGEAMTANEAPFVAGKGYTMLPVRALAESLGLKADWNSNTKTATFSNASKVASVVIGADTMYVNGTPIPLNAKAEIKNGSTFIELRSLASAFGVELQWDAATKTVTIIG